MMPDPNAARCLCRGLEFADYCPLHGVPGPSMTSPNTAEPLPLDQHSGPWMSFYAARMLALDVMSQTLNDLGYLAASSPPGTEPQ